MTFTPGKSFYNIYQGLMGYPAGKTNLVPNLAESYTVSEDGGMGYIFKLREGPQVLGWHAL
jgi:ABC-type transport system substrate-binding protein